LELGSSLIVFVIDGFLDTRLQLCGTCRVLLHLDEIGLEPGSSLIVFSVHRRLDRRCGRGGRGGGSSGGGSAAAATFKGR
jgi:hypothetical protein